MQIVVNTRLLLKNRLEGIGWFSFQTLQRIARKHSRHHFVFLFDRPFSEDFIFSSNVTPLVAGPQARHPFLYYWWFQVTVKGILKKMQPSLFLSPDGFLPLNAPCPTLPVIHDLNFVEHPADLRWLTARYYNHFFPRFARQASRIATVSEFSKSQIIRHYRVEPQKIDVVYNGVNPFFRPFGHDEKITARKKFSGGRHYFINVGSLHPRKNIANLVRAFAEFKKESRSDKKLMLAGPHFWGLSDIYKVIEEKGMRDEVIFTGRLQDEDLAQALGAADALTFIPYYEGFGIPVIEAMQAEVPVITSSVTSLPEVAGDAALLVNPNDLAEMKNAMLKIHRDPVLAGELVSKGRSQKEKFSWDRSADLLWQSIERAAAQR